MYSFIKQKAFTKINTISETTKEKIKHKSCEEQQKDVLNYVFFFQNNSKRNWEAIL